MKVFSKGSYLKHLKGGFHLRYFFNFFLCFSIDQELDELPTLVL